MLPNETRALSLAELFERGIGSAVIGDAGLRVAGVRHDSRECEAGDLFAAVRGEKFDGSRFVPQALERGAVAVISDTLQGISVPVMRSESVRRDLSLASHLVYGDPTRAMQTIGITGTNGKTTTTFLVDSALRALGKKSALMGTVLQRIESDEPSTHTTLEGDDIARFAARALRAGCTHLAMEVSSHGLAQHRVDGVHFAVAAFTNLTQDHLDYHGTMGAYRAAKARLFIDFSPRSSVINIDDEVGRDLAQSLKGEVWKCSTRKESNADVSVQQVSQTRDVMNVQIRLRGRPVQMEIPLLGQHNLENALVTIACLSALGFEAPAIVDAMRKVQTAPGRLQRVSSAADDVDVFVDYAHTPDAISRVLHAVRPWVRGRLVVVFGAGGDRDRSKRAPMGRAAGENADIVFVTSDNPRAEDPMRIIADVKEGVVEKYSEKLSLESIAKDPSARGYVIEADRAQALAQAIAHARAGDLIVVAGKGHEQFQIIKDVQLAFSDLEHSRRALLRRRGDG